MIDRCFISILDTTALLPLHVGHGKSKAGVGLIKTFLNGFVYVSPSDALSDFLFSSLQEEIKISCS